VAAGTPVGCPGSRTRSTRSLLPGRRFASRTCRARSLEQRAAAVAPALLELPGCGAVTAAKLLAEMGPISRFKTDAQLARHSGVAPPEASSGKNQRHRLDRGGNRQLNAALYRIAITQSRYHPAARAYLERKQAEGKSKREAIRCLKRLLARTVFNTLKASPALT
jgi:transposase